MATRAQKVRLSVFLIVSGTALLVLFLFLVGSRMMKRMDWYYIEYRNISVTGLEAGASVKYQGVPVGRVTGLSIKDASTVRVEIEIDHGTPIKSDSEAILTLVGITGLKFVEIIGGSQESDILEVGGTIQAGESMFETISGRAEVILGKLEQVLNNLNILLSQETTQAIQDALVSIDELTSEVKGIVSANKSTVTSTMCNLDTLVVRLSATALELNTSTAALADIMESDDLRNSIANISHISDRMKTQVDSLKLAETVDDFRTFVNNGNNMVVHTDLMVLRSRDDILRSISNLEEALDNLREATDVIRDDPSILLRGRQTSSDRVE